MSEVARSEAHSVAHPARRESSDLDRRDFLSGLAMVAGAAIAGVTLPLSAAVAEASVGTNADGLWSVDVMCGHWPPYSHPIPYGRMEMAATSLAAADDEPTLDHMLVA